jgi:hypothetical protein
MPSLCAIHHPEMQLACAQGRLADAGRFRHGIKSCSPFTFDQDCPRQMADLAHVDAKRSKWHIGYRFRSSP